MVLFDLSLQDSSSRNKSLNRMIPTANPAGQHGAESSVTWVADQYYNQSVRTEWDWENPIIFAQNPTSIANPLVESDHSDQKPTSILAPTPLANIRPYNQAPSYGGSSLAPTFPAQNGIMYTFSSGLRNYEDLHAYHALSDAHNSLNSGIPGVAATSNNLNAEFRSYEQRRRFLGMIDLERGIGTDLIKREDVYLGDGRIGLNLGGRTYFSHEDSMEGRLGKRNRLTGPGAHVPRCQAEGCTADLSKAKHYHRRHKVCEIHSKAPNVYANGQTQRFCQQCSRFHPLSEFDDTKRSCRKRLADHNRRRRKPQPNTVSVSITMPDPLAFKSEAQSSINHSSAMADNRPALLKNNSNSTEAGGSNPKMDSDHHTQGSRSEEKEESSRSIVVASSAADSELLSSVPRSASPSKRRFSSIDPAAVYQQFLQGPGQTKLSLSSSSTHQGENSVNWLKSGSPSRSFDASGSEKFGDSRSCSRSTRFLGESGKGLLKIHSPRHNSSSDWMVSPVSGCKDHDPTDQHRQMVAFLENPVRSGGNNQARNSASSVHMDHSSMYESSSSML